GCAVTWTAHCLICAYCGRSYTWTCTPSEPTVLASTSRSFSRSIPSGNRRRPRPSTVGKTIRCSSSTRSPSSSVATSVPLPATRMSPSVSPLSLASASGTSPEITDVFCHSGFVSVVDTTYFGSLLSLSANGPSREGQALAKPS